MKEGLLASVIRILDGGMTLEDNIMKFELINIFPFDDKFCMDNGSVTSLEERTEKCERQTPPPDGARWNFASSPQPRGYEQVNGDGLV